MNSRQWQIIEELENFELQDNSEVDYILEFLIPIDKTENELIVSEVFNCLERNNFLSSEMIQFAFNYFEKTSHYIPILSLCDYLLKGKELVIKQFNEQNKSILQEAMNHRYRIVKNQILLCLCCFDIGNKSEYEALLLSSFKQTNDYRSFIRFFNSVDNYSLRETISESVKDEVKKIAKRKKFGRSVLLAMENV